MRLSAALLLGFSESAISTLYGATSATFASFGLVVALLDLAALGLFGVPNDEHVRRARTVAARRGRGAAVPAPGGRVAAGLTAAWPIVSGEQLLRQRGDFLGLTMIGATSLHLIIRTGHISMAHAAFMGVAGYMAALAITRLALPFPVALMLGCRGAALLALVIGPIVLRLTGKYFVLFTFLFGEIIRLVFVEWSSLTGGSNGLYDSPPSARCLQIAVPIISLF